jgi:tRNA 2-thiouridine synthesizing protein A
MTHEAATQSAETIQLDARGLNCPMPIVRTAQAIKTLTTGQLLEVLATDPGSVADFAAYRFVLRRK